MTRKRSMVIGTSEWGFIIIYKTYMLYRLNNCNFFRYTNRYKQTRHRQNIEMRHRQMNSPSVNRGVGAPICPTEF